MHHTTARERERERERELPSMHLGEVPVALVQMSQSSVSSNIRDSITQGLQATSTRWWSISMKPVVHCGAADRGWDKEPGQIQLVSHPSGTGPIGDHRLAKMCPAISSNLIHVWTIRRSFKWSMRNLIIDRIHASIYIYIYAQMHTSRMGQIEVLCNFRYLLQVQKGDAELN